MSIHDCDIHDSHILRMLLRHREGLGVNTLAKETKSKATILKHLYYLRKCGIVRQVRSPTHKQKRIQKLTSRGVTLATKFATHEYAGYIGDRWIQECEREGYDDFRFLSDFTRKDGHKTFLVAINRKVRDMKIAQLFEPRDVRFFGLNPKKSEDTASIERNTIQEFLRRHVIDFGDEQKLARAMSDFYYNREHFGGIASLSFPKEALNLGIPHEFANWEAFVFLGVGYEKDVPDAGVRWPLAFVRIPETPFVSRLTAELNLRKMTEILRELVKGREDLSADELDQVLPLSLTPVAKCDNAFEKENRRYCSVSNGRCDPPQRCPLSHLVAHLLTQHKEGIPEGDKPLFVFKVNT